MVVVVVLVVVVVVVVVVVWQDSHAHCGIKANRETRKELDIR